MIILFQVAIHHEGHADLSESVEDLEKRNLEIMSEMFDCKVEDLKFTRSVFFNHLGWLHTPI